MLGIIAAVIYFTGAGFFALLGYNDYLTPTQIAVGSIGWPVFVLFALGQAVFN